RGKIICWMPSPEQKGRALADVACCQFAWTFAKGMSLLLCTSYNLSKIMQMFDITPIPQAAAQLLLWIQDGLDHLKDMPPNPEKDEKFVAGEAVMSIDGQKFTRDMEFTETEVIEQEHGLN